MTARPAVEGATRVLVLVDHQPIAEVVKLTLNHGVYVTREASTVAEALAILDEWSPHLGVVELDDGDGVVEQFAQRGDGHLRIPVLALTRRGDLKTKLAAFDHGVEDIMTVPFSPEELLARVMVIARRALGRPVPVTPRITLGELEIDILNRRVQVGDTVLHLTAVEQSLLYLLAANAGRLLTRDVIMDAIWGPDFVADSNVVDRHVRNLRIKLGDRWRRPRYIATVPGQGYRFLPQVPAAGPRPSPPLPSSTR